MNIFAKTRHTILDIIRRVAGTYQIQRKLDLIQESTDNIKINLANINSEIDKMRDENELLNENMRELYVYSCMSDNHLWQYIYIYKKINLYIELLTEHWDECTRLWQRFDIYGKEYLDINGVCVTAPIRDAASKHDLINVFSRTFFIKLFFNDNYHKDVVVPVERHIWHVRQYFDNDINCTISPGDICIDAGAWMGGFSAYAESKGGIVHAFEPTEQSFRLLEHTAKLNKHIIPVNVALGNLNGLVDFLHSARSATNRCRMQEYDENDENRNSIKVQMSTLDTYVEQNSLESVDFLKADVEGNERYLLRGSTKTLRRFAPKLSIATYHLPDDPEVLRSIIEQANPTYKFVQLKTVLFAEGKRIEGIN